MTVDELRELLAPMSGTARVTVRIRKNVEEGKGGDPALEELYEFREATIETVLYNLGEAIIQLDEDALPGEG